MQVKKLFLMQKPMLRVCYSLLPLVVFSIYLFGWRSLGITLIVLLCGVAGEAVFTLYQGKPVSSAVFVTCLIFSLSLPPTIPIHMAVIGIIFGVVFGKMVFGGFGQNTFNPAMVGRCFIYITFPRELTNDWMEPLWEGLGGLVSWVPFVDAITSATPLLELRNNTSISLADLLIGNVSGSMGETSVILILCGGVYLLWKRIAPWRLMLSCLLGGSIICSLLQLWDASIPSLMYSLFSGSFIFGSVFVATEPVTGPKDKKGQWIYGAMVGGLTMVLRYLSNFAEGFMFSILIMNAFVPILEHAIHMLKNEAKVSHEENS